MPKKFGTNTKSAEARGRKEAIRQAEKEKKEQEAEDALWRDDDKHVQRKQQRKDDKERKKQEQLDKKMAREVAYEEEMSSIKAAKPVSIKMMRAEIAKVVENENASEKSKKLNITDEQPLEENVNRIIVEDEVARDIDEAISILSVSSEKVDQHPERRMKAAYQAFEDLHLPRLKAENPNLRLSQLKQMLKKDWMKSPDNPINQRHAAYNMKKQSH